jgi:hypothetical protein
MPEWSYTKVLIRFPHYSAAVTGALEIVHQALKKYDENILLRQSKRLG